MPDTSTTFCKKAKGNSQKRGCGIHPQLSVRPPWWVSQIRGWGYTCTDALVGTADVPPHQEKAEDKEVPSHWIAAAIFLMNAQVSLSSQTRSLGRPSEADGTTRPAPRPSFAAPNGAFVLPTWWASTKKTENKNAHCDALDGDRHC